MSFRPSPTQTVIFDDADKPNPLPAGRNPLAYDDGRSQPPRRNRAPLGMWFVLAVAFFGMLAFMCWQLAGWFSNLYHYNSFFGSFVLACLYFLLLVATLGAGACMVFLAMGLFGSMAKRGLFELPGGLSVHSFDALSGYQRRGVNRLADATLDQHFGVQQTLAQQSQYRNVSTYSPSVNYSYSSKPEGRADVGDMGGLLLPPGDLPGPVDLDSLGFTPSLDRVLLGLDETGAPVSVPLAKLWHIATAGPTGNGKSNIHRLLLGQVLAMGGKVAIGDPKWTRFDLEQDEDWTPIEQRLHLAPAATADQIGALLDWSNGELQQRLERRRNQQKAGGPLFICLDELPWIADNVKGSADQIGELVRLGRGVGVFVMAAAQDFLVKTVSLSGARDNFRSAFYLGGDLRTGSVLLDMPQRELSQVESQLGVGIALLRSAATPAARLVRVPYVSNPSLYHLLEGRESQPSKGLSEDLQTGQKMGFKPSAGKSFESQSESYRKSADTPKTQDATTARILALFSQGNSIAEIVKAIYSVTSGAKYNEYRAEVEKIIRGALVAA